MSAFEKRIKKASKLQMDVVHYLNENNISYIETGYENLTGNFDANYKIIKNSDNTSIFIRYYPDILVVYTGLSIFLEIKNSTGIEKECYYNYKKLIDQFGVIIYLVNKDMKICRINSLKLKESNPYDRISNMKIPITDMVWREPRKMSRKDYMKYLEAYNGRTSGCSFAFIDFDLSPFESIEILKIFNS